MSCAVEGEARTVTGKKAIAVESFSKALRMIPTILADNAGYDSSDLVSRLRAAHRIPAGTHGRDIGEAHQRNCPLLQLRDITYWLLVLLVPLVLLVLRL